MRIVALIFMCHMKTENAKAICTKTLTASDYPLLLSCSKICAHRFRNFDRVSLLSGKYALIGSGILTVYHCFQENMRS
jgi:hypothetical protein